MNQKCRIPVVRFDDWPANDREAWICAVQQGEFLEEPGALAHYSSHRLASVRSAFGRWLGYLNRTVTEGIGTSGIVHLDRDRVASYLEELRRDLAPRSAVTYLEDLGYAIRAMAPDRDVSCVFAAGRYMRRFTRSTRNKRARIRPVQELYELGLGLMLEAETLSGSVAAAVVFRDGLTIAYLAAQPIRVGNLASIEIGRHLVKRGEVYCLEFPAEEVKNRRSLEIQFPSALVGLLERYLDEHRPVLAARAKLPDDRVAAALWLSRLGTLVTTNRMWVNISKRTKRHFGHSINPHLFGDAVATSIAIDDPVHVRMIKSILGHASLATAERHYIQATSLQAARRVQADILSRRHGK